MNQETVGDDIVLTRTLDAPRYFVWRAWTERERVEQWWGADGFSVRVEHLDLRPGGGWRYVMLAPDGAEQPFVGTFREVVPFERIVTAPGLPDGVVVTCRFEDVGARTRLTLRIAHHTPEDRTAHVRKGVESSWQSMFDGLERYLRAQDTLGRGPSPPTT